MANETLAVIWRPHEHADEYLVFVDDEAEYKQWKEQPVGGKDIALARFIGNFEIVSSWMRMDHPHFHPRHAITLTR